MNWAKLKTRLLSAGILVVFLLLVTFAPAWVFSLAVCGASFVVLREITVTFKQEKKHALVIAEYIFAVCYMATAFLQQDTGNKMMYLITILFVMTLLSISVLDHKDTTFQDVCASLFVVLYSVLLPLHIAFLRTMEQGLALVFLAFIGAFLTDTGAYFTGSLLGKHKLIEAVSPNKTIEGAIGGVIASVVAFMLYGFILTGFGFSVNFVNLGILSVICGVVSQLGDLSASVMKRTYQAKDFGNLIPGHGGLVDRVDSLLFVAPVVYYFVTYFSVL